MPNRIIKESILTSPTMAAMSAEVERHFYRLLLLSDDHGCLECTPAVVRGKCYSLHSVTTFDVVLWNDELADLGVIHRWTENEREYLVFHSFDKFNSKYAVTDDGKPTRHRRKTPIPPSDIKLNGISQALPEEANTSLSLHNPNPNPKPKHISLHTSPPPGDRCEEKKKG